MDDALNLAKRLRRYVGPQSKPGFAATVEEVCALLERIGAKVEVREATPAERLAEEANGPGKGVWRPLGGF